MREGTSLPSPPLLFIAFFTPHRSPLSERLEQATVDQIWKNFAICELMTSIMPLRPEDEAELLW